MTRATLMPSADVPLMMPATIMEWVPEFASSLASLTSSPNSHTCRESFSSLAGLGAGGLRFNAGRFFLEGQHTGGRFLYSSGKLAVRALLP